MDHAKKKIALLTIRDSISHLYQEELTQVFDGYLEILPFSMDRGFPPWDPREISLLLTTGPKVYSSYRYLSSPQAKVIDLDHDFVKKRVDLLSDFPYGTNALVCFNYVLVGYKTAAILYEMGISNLNLTVYHPATPIDASKFDLVVTDDLTNCIPPGIPRIVSLGRRKISFDTLLDIALHLNLLDHALEKRINDYCKESTSSYRYASSIFHDFSSNKIQMQSLIDFVDYGIATADDSYRIIGHNRLFSDCFQLSPSLEGENLLQLGVDCIRDFMKKEGMQKNQLVKDRLTGKTFLMSKIAAKTPNKQEGFMLLVKDVTEMASLKQQLKNHVESKNLTAKYTFDDIRGTSPLLLDCIRKAKIIAKIDKPTLIMGESGTGKELFVQSIHNASRRSEFPFIGINCAHLPPSLLESELFGYEEGSFTGAKKKGKPGLFELVNHGTLFLDELGEMNLETQAKLLRVLEEKEIIRLGGQRIISIDVRVITASNRDLQELVHEGRFRLDLYYRLNTLTLKIPPLRQRRQDIPELIRYFLRKEGFDDILMDDEVREYLYRAPFEGNVRELRSCIEYMANISEGHIGLQHLPDYMQPPLPSSPDPEGGSDSWEPGPEEGPRPQTPPGGRPSWPRSPELFLNQQDLVLVRDILLALRQKKQGRRELHAALKKQHRDLSEYKLRTMLTFLKNRGYLDFERGRGGTRLLPEGFEALLRLPRSDEEQPGDSENQGDE